MIKETNLMNEENNYLVQKLHKDVECKGIPSRILLHLRLTHLVVVRGNEVLEIL